MGSQRIGHDLATEQQQQFCTKQQIIHGDWPAFTYTAAAAAAAKSLQSSPTLCDPIDSSPPGSPVPRILQARTLEWVAISFSSGWKWKVKGKSLSHVRLLATPWTAAFQAPPSMGFARQEYWSGVPLPSPKFKYWLVNSYYIGVSWSPPTMLAVSKSWARQCVCLSTC